MTPEAARAACLEYLRAGRLAEAEAAARALPPGAEALHLQGVVAARAGRVADALALLDAALACGPASAPLLLDQGIARLRLGHPEAALVSLAEAVVLDPGFAAAWNTHGRVLLDLGRREAALESFDAALRAEPDHADALANRGDALRLLGQDDAAMASYTRALALKPAQARAATGGGILLNAAGQHLDALAAHDRAIRIAPGFADAHNGRGVALAWLGRTAEALASFARALALRPGHAEALVNTAHALRAAGRTDDALEAYDRAIAAVPTSLEALHARSLILAERERLEEALAGYDAALALRPEFPQALVAKGNLLSRLARYAEALECYDRALALAPGLAEARTAHASTLRILDGTALSAEARFLRGDALRLLERHAEAVVAYDEAIALRPDDPQAWNHRGIALQELGEDAEALASYDQALRLRPDSAAALANRSAALRGLGRMEEAIASARRALALDPDNLGAHSSLGQSLRILGRIDEALVHFEATIALTPDDGPRRFNRATCLLLAGDFENGWREYEWRWTLQDMAAFKRRVNRPPWLGREDIAGRTILLYSEQGHGDTIQFCRYIPLVAALGARVVLGLSPLLRDLVAAMPGVSQVIEHEAEAPQFDTHAPLLSLPHAFGTTLDTVPATVPYLTPPAGRLAAWRARLGRRTAPRIGLAWSGNAEHKDDRNRSIPLALMARIIGPGARWYCLQKELRPDDVHAFATGAIQFLGPELHDFSDTAALTSLMDLVISVDTAVLHLAGALGRPAWGLLPFAPDWRWMLDRTDSPWYPTMRLFRQPAPGDWHTVIAQVRDALAASLDQAENKAPSLRRLTKPSAA